MGAIKDVVDLITQLLNKVEDRRLAEELRGIQSMINNILSEHASIHEQRIELMTENAELKQKNAALELAIVGFKEEIANIRNSPKIRTDSLSEEAEKILSLLAKQDDLAAYQISDTLSIEPVKTEFWLEELEKKAFILGSYVMGQETTYFLDQGGRKYLIDKNLI
jgi:hypothetical protein